MILRLKTITLLAPLLFALTSCGERVVEQAEESATVEPNGPSEPTANEDASTVAEGTDSSEPTSGESEDSPPEEEVEATDAAEPTAAVYSFEEDSHRWVTGSHPEECPNALLSLAPGQGLGGSQALAWEVPNNFEDRCVVGVNIRDFPPEAGATELDDRSDLEVACWIKVPEEMRDGSTAFDDREYFGFWMLDDDYRGHFSDDYVTSPSDPEWLEIKMRPGQVDYQTVEGELAARDPDFGELQFVRIWARSNNQTALSQPIFIDDCSIRPLQS